MSQKDSNMSLLSISEVAKNSENTETSIRKSDKNIKLKENELRIIESVVSIGVNKIIDVMTAVGNVLNARSNIDSVDRYMTTFNSLFNSRGGGNLFAYYYMIANFWVVFDAAVMVFRSWENRFAERKANVEALQAQQDTNSAVEETLAALSEANAQLVLLKDGLNNLIRRKDIRRKGRLLAFKERSLEEKQIDKYSGNEFNDEKDDNSKKEEEEEEEEEPKNEDVTKDANSSQEDIVSLSDNREDIYLNISVNQEFDENFIPE